MPTLSKQWTDHKPFTRRVQWLCSSLEDRDSGIVLKFEDGTGLFRRHYGEDAATAAADWQSFRGGIGVSELRSRYARR